MCPAKRQKGTSLRQPQEATEQERHSELLWHAGKPPTMEPQCPPKHPNAKESKREQE